MKPIFLRSVFLLCAATIQISFVNTLFPSFLFPLPILLSVVVAFTILKGFAFSWTWAVVGGIFFDALSLGRIGGASFELVCAAAVFSLTAKELLFRYRLSRILLFGVAVWIFEGVLRGTEVSFLFFHLEKATISFFSFANVHWSPVFWSLVLSVALFALIFPLVAMLERYVELFERTRVGRR